MTIIIIVMRYLDGTTDDLGTRKEKMALEMTRRHNPEIKMQQ